MHFHDDVGDLLDLGDLTRHSDHSILSDVDAAIQRATDWQRADRKRGVIPFAFFVERVTSFRPCDWAEDVFRIVVRMVLNPSLPWGCIDTLDWDERRFEAHLGSGTVLTLIDGEDGHSYVAAQ